MRDGALAGIRVTSRKCASAGSNRRGKVAASKVDDAPAKGSGEGVGEGSDAGGGGECVDDAVVDGGTRDADRRGGDDIGEVAAETVAVEGDKEDGMAGRGGRRGECGGGLGVITM